MMVFAGVKNKSVPFSVLVSGDEQKLLKEIEKLLNRKLPQKIVEGFLPEPGKVAESTQRKQAHPAGNNRRRGKVKPAGNGGGTKGRKQRKNVRPKSGQVAPTC
jgi:ATP-dependent RNA helicase RhlE